MRLRLLALCAAFALAPAAPALAAGKHAGGHHDELAVGQPGKASKVKRTVEVLMKETEDGRMLFEPSSLEVTKGETIRFRVVNAGETDHEFVLDSEPALMEHKAVMEKFPEMEHDDPNAVRLAPGATGDIVWQFTKAGQFAFGCLIPGHWEAGMKGDLAVAGQ